MLHPEVFSFFDEPTNTASYVLKDPATNAAAIIDSVLDFDAEANALALDGLRIEAASATEPTESSIGLFLRNSMSEVSLREAVDLFRSLVRHLSEALLAVLLQFLARCVQRGRDATSQDQHHDHARTRDRRLVPSRRRDRELQARAAQRRDLVFDDAPRAAESAIAGPTAR